METISGVIIAGGRSRRMGQDKRKLRLWGTHGPTLLEHTISVVAPLCAECIVVLNDPKEWRGLAAHIVGDACADGGALGGICSGLAVASHGYALVVAADMPLLNPALLRAMAERPRSYTALVPRSPRTGNTRNTHALEPLHAIYRRTLLDPLQHALESGTRRITDVLQQIPLDILEPAEWTRYDPHGHSFRNINTPEDLVEVRRIIGVRG